VRETELTGSCLRVAFEGSADHLVKTAARYRVSEIRTREQDLEELFLRYYQEPEK
jgi:hypothetical protein